MSPLRPTNASRTTSSSSGSVISPLGVMLCILATLVTVPVLLSSGASSDADEVVAVEVPETVSASDLEADVDIDEMFDAGAKLDDVPEPQADTMPDAERAASLSVAGAVEAESTNAESVEGPTVEGSTVESPASAPTPTTSTTISEAPATAAPRPTDPPSTQAPATTEPPATTAAPTTAAPTTTESAPAEEDPAVAEEPQGAEEAAETEAAETEAAETEAAPAPSGPTAEQWAALRHCESSGNYSIISRNGLYHGAYQFYQPTWDGLARQLGRTDLVGLAPSQAAPGDQDALALLLWQQRGNQPWPHCGRHLPAGP